MASSRIRRMGTGLLVAALTLGVGCQQGASRTPQQLGAEAFERGVQADVAGKNDEATAHYFEALAREPKNKSAFYNLGQLYRRTNELQIAEGYYRQALRIDANFTGALFGLGFTRLAAGDWQVAADANRKVVAAEPNNAAAHFNLALALRGLGNEAQAQEEFARARQLDASLVPPPAPSPSRSAAPTTR